MSNMRGEFLRWSGEHGGYGCEEAAFEAGWEAALNTVVTSNTSTNIASDAMRRFDDVDIESLSDHDLAWTARIIVREYRAALTHIA